MTDSLLTTEQTTFTPTEAAKLLRCSADQVRALIAAGRLSAVNTSLGRKRARYVITREAIDAFLSPTTTRLDQAKRPPKTTKRWI